MSAREGSVWVEGNEFCYVDESGDKNCLSFEEVRQRMVSIDRQLESLTNNINSIRNNVQGLESVDEILVDSEPQNTQNGIIFHEGPGETLNGINVEDDEWVEIFGKKIHISTID